MTLTLEDETRDGSSQGALLTMNRRSEGSSYPQRRSCRRVRGVWTKNLDCLARLALDFSLSDRQKAQLI